MITSPKLEERYIVVKITDLESVGQREAMQEWLRNYQIKTRDCVVVEADWPQYSAVVDMIIPDNAAPQPSDDAKDAARYRFLKSKCDTGFITKLEDNVFVSRWDVAIDAAMAGGGV